MKWKFIDYGLDQQHVYRLYLNKSSQLFIWPVRGASKLYRIKAAPLYILNGGWTSLSAQRKSHIADLGGQCKPVNLFCAWYFMQIWLRLINELRCFFVFMYQLFSISFVKTYNHFRRHSTPLARPIHRSSATIVLNGFVFHWRHLPRLFIKY